MIAGALYPGIKRVQSPARSKADGILLIQRVHRRFEFDDAERRSRADQRPFPEPAVEKELSRMRFVVARPLEAAACFEARVAHSRMQRAQPAYFIPDIFRARVATIMSESPRQVTDDFDVIASAAGRVEGLAHALDTALAAGHCAFRFAPAGRRGQDYMGEFSGCREEKVLYGKELKSLEKMYRAVLVGL